MSTLNAMFNNTLVGRFLNWKQGDEEEIWRVKALEVLIKKVNRANQADNLKLALGRKKEATPCVTLDRSKDGRLQVMHRKMLPQVMYCRIFRWPDLQSQHELRSVSSCKWPAHVRELQEICVNPYHYSRVDHSGYPPVVSPRSNNNSNVFADASPPPYSPMSPDSNYSPHQQSPTYLSQAPFQTSPNQLENPNDPYSYSQLQLQTSSQPLGLTNHANQPTVVVEANGWYGGPLPLMGGAPSEENMQPTRSESWVRSSPFPGYSAIDRTIPMEINDDLQPARAPSAVDKNRWCKIFYFELNQRVGEPFASSARIVTINGGTEPEDPNRFSLGLLTNPNRSRPVQQTRNFIGNGITLENDGAQIYVKNMSDHSVFFCSKICNVENQLNQHTVVKIEPGRRQKMFDHKIFEDLLQEALRSNDGKIFERLMSLLEHSSIKLSFVKGWGSIYKRQDVTSTPCWIEIQLLKYYTLIDQYLPQTKPSTQITSTS